MIVTIGRLLLMLVVCRPFRRLRCGIRLILVGVGVLLIRLVRWVGGVSCRLLLTV